jgi:4-hydroxy-tetrahydrodipicolinate synthase
MRRPNLSSPIETETVPMTATVHEPSADDRPSRVAPPQSGVLPPIVTPMRPDGSADLESLRSLVDSLIGQGVTGLLVLGSCGENAAIPREERLEIAAAAAERVADRCHLLIGLPALGTREAVADAAAFAAAGAHALLVPAPYGFPLSQLELERHFEAIAEAAGIPLLAYNIPTRVNVWLEVELLENLARRGVIAGIKDSSGNIERQRVIAESTKGLQGFRRYTGSEECIDALLLGGFHGSVPGLANVAAPLHVRLAELAAAGDWAGAADMQGRIVAISDLYAHALPGGGFSAQAIGALKEGLRQQGVIQHSTTAFPFVQPDEGMEEHVRGVLRRLAELLP